MPTSSKITVSLAVSFAFVAIAFYKYSSKNDDSLERGVIKAWSTIKPPPKTFQKLAVGINSNVDIVVSGVALLNALQVLPGRRKNNEILNSLDDLQETFSYFFSRGSAAERSFMDKIVFQKITKVAETLPDVEHFIGGNAALMAKQASQLFPQVKIHFVGPVGPLLENLMPRTVEIPKSCHISKDEVHIIMEYKIQEQWGNISAPVANRFITSYDESNSKILMMEPYFESIKSIQPDLILLSGLSQLDGQPTDFAHHRLDKLVSLLKEVPSSIPVHLELASMANDQVVRHILEKVLTGVDSLGVNEQELVFSSKVTGGPHHDYFDHDNHGQPEVHKIADIILWIFDKYGRSAQNPSSRLTRIHFHSLTYHIMAVVESVWGNVENAAAAGARIAGTQACDVQELKEDLVDIKIPLTFKLHTGDDNRVFDPHNPISSWRKNDYLFVFSPVLVCKQPVRTVGLGDAISATGLMFSHFFS